MVWIWVDMLRTTVWCLVLVYLIDESWMISVDVVIHLLRCGLAIVLRCRGLSKVGCSGEGLVHGVWQVLESAKDLFLGVDPLGQHVLPCVWSRGVTPGRPSTSTAQVSPPLRAADAGHRRGPPGEGGVIGFFTNHVGVVPKSSRVNKFKQ
jgi:hypothetical protein